MGYAARVSTSPNYKSLDALMRHIRQTSGMAISGAAQKQSLAEVGYFHGYKGYRFSGSSARRIPYTDFSELLAVIDFDRGLKALFYPLLMRLEMALKNLAITAILDAAGSSNPADIYTRLMPGDRREGRRGKLEVIHRNNALLLSAYKRNNAMIRHYYDSPTETVPLWALMEIMSLGHFARFLEQLDWAVLRTAARAWGLQKRDEDLVPHLVFALTELRNSVAHDGVVFDTRFSTARVRKQVPELLERELQLPLSISVTFRTITDYLLLTLYLARGLGCSSQEVATQIRHYGELTDGLRSTVHRRVSDTIVHSDNRAKLDCLQAWLQTS